MKTFVELRELAGRKKSGKKVFSKRVNRIRMEIYDDKGKFIVYIDGDRLDAYKNQKEAEKAGMMFMKQYKGM
tara:strand:- start:353 stop:568 length:216 start_codon:yes stop_codon:yes gene_type:complete